MSKVSVEEMSRKAGVVVYLASRAPRYFFVCFIAVSGNGRRFGTVKKNSATFLLGLSG
jgi:hypothetical protein